jgi:beta-mannosidase
MDTHIDLNGVWQLRWNDGQRGGPVSRLLPPDADTSRALEAQVPGSVHLDLIRAGLLAEPTVGLNHLAARWVEETIWHYRRAFVAPALAPGQRAYLTFETLDLAAVIYLNGVEVGTHANAFYPCTLDVTGQLREGENILVVQIESGLYSVADRPGKGYSMQIDSELQKRNWLRKTQSSFGWDWSARLLGVGISGDVRLDIVSGARLERFVALATLSDDMQTGAVTGRLFFDGLVVGRQSGALTVTIAETGDSAVVATATAEIEIVPGAQSAEARVVVEHPRLWWPVGHGDQPLYTVSATLTLGGQIVAQESRRVGFRKVVVDQSPLISAPLISAPHPEGGRSFIIRVNDRPIFCKGANFVPADMILARLDRARYQTLVERALECNMNLLRIWGGGLYESDDLYERCDERGLLVWQEFIFACAKYPATDEHFLADIKREAAHQVRRLAHHPSLIVWCGNNELEWGAYAWGYERGVAYPDYALFHMVLPVILKQEDGTRYYQPSSPFSPDHEPPNCDEMGDQHPWSIGMADTDFRKYRQMTSRFPNEGGILGPTALPTVRACLPPGHERPTSFAFEQHDNAVAYWGGARSYPDEMLAQWLGRRIEEMSIEEYVYYAGIVQGEGLHEYIRNFRRRMFSTSSAIFWMYNDCWPATRSWTVVDYYLRRTPAFHPVRRAFAPLAVFLAVEGGEVRVFGVNEGAAWAGEARYGLFGLAGGYPLDETRRVQLPANASTLLGAFPLAELESRERTHGAFALLVKDGEIVSSDKLFLPYYKELTWPQAAVCVRREGERAIFESDVFCWRVCLDLDGEQPLPDNLFDILPGIPTALPWPKDYPEPRVLRVYNN